MIHTKFIAFCRVYCKPPRIDKAERRVEKGTEKNTANCETDIIIAGSIEALGYFFVFGINNQLFERSSPFVSITFLYQ